MKKICRFIIAASVLVAVACTVQEIPTEMAPADEETVEEGCCEPGVVNVLFSEEMAAAVSADLAGGGVRTRSSELNSFAEAYGITSIKRVFSDDERWLERQHRAGLDRWYTITYDPSAVKVTKAAESLGNIPGVEIAEPSHRAKPTAVNYFYNDEYYSQQWHLCGAHGINVEPVWQYYTKGDPDVIIAVVDGGIDYLHPELAANFIPAGEGGSKNFITGKYTITGHYHGTHVAGILAAVSNNGAGVAGIAGGDYAEGVSGVRLLNCQVFNDLTSAGDGDLAEAIKYGADNGALISQNSWGYEYDSEEEASRGYTPAVLSTAIDYFIENAGCDNDGNQIPDSKMKGGVVFFAAGNEGIPYGFPASYESCIAVAATCSDGSLADYSNYGDWVDICAPGDDIISTYYYGGYRGYAYASGTSMACPMVSGVAALVLSYQGGYGFTNEMLKECILKGADPDKGFSNAGPFLDALGSVLYGAMDPPQPIESFSAAASSNTITVNWKVPAGDEDGTTPAYGVLLCAGTDKNSVDNIDPKNLSSDLISTSVKTIGEEIGSEVSGTLTVNQFNTTYYVTCIPYNYGSNYGSAAPAQAVMTGENNPPVITPSSPLDNVQVKAAGSLTLSFSVEDPEGHDFSVSWTTGSIAEKWQKYADGSYVLTITGNAMDGDSYVETGTYTTSLVAVDAYGAESVCSFDYTILDNEAPVLNKALGNVLLVLGDSSTRTAELDLSDCFTDPDGDFLSYSVDNSSPTTLNAFVNTSVDISGSDTTSTAKLYLTAFKAGTATVTLTATDPRGKSASQDLIVAVRSEGETVIVYPNPVSGTLYVSTEQEEASTTVRVYSGTGSLVYEGTSTASAFTPAEVDFSGLAPGTYSVNVRYGSRNVTKKVVKI